MSLFTLMTLLLWCCGCQQDGPGDIPNPGPPKKADVAMWLSNGDQSVKFTEQSGAVSVGKMSNGFTTINIDPETTYQEMDGFGFTLTGGSALHIHEMSSSARKELLKELFAWDGDNIGVSYLRISVGASDLDAYPFSYDDLPDGETDTDLSEFTLDEDRKHLIPVLKEILAINPELKLMGSPWSAPAWMKSNNDTRGGSLKPEYYDAYADYLVKYVQQMAEEGIHIDALTVQNEPLHPGNNPSMLMYAADQAIFVRDHLGPAFENAGLDTRIIVYDHNADRPDYPITILDDPEANKYVDGSAFHLYAGQISALSQVHTAYPDKDLYFTEQWIGAPGDFPSDLQWHTRELIIGATRNWCKTVLEWNLAADQDLEPHTDRGGCSQCLGALTIEGNEVTRNPAYYIIAHASKFVRPGSVRIDTNMPNELPNVAFKTPDGGIVIIVLNNTSSEKSFNMNLNDQLVTSTIRGGAVGTYIF